MNFLPDVYVPCEVCHGARYNRETLEVHYKGKTIAEVLDMPIEEALEFFEAIPAIARHLQTLNDVGLGYVRLGQPAADAVRRRGPAGQARLRAAEALHRPHGLRARRADHRPALRGHPQAAGVLGRLVDKGNTVIVIEHNLDVIKTADWVIDMGPEGGHRGGLVVAEGTPEEVADGRRAATPAQFLRAGARSSSRSRPGAGQAAGGDPAATARRPGAEGRGEQPKTGPAARTRAGPALRRPRWREGGRRVGGRARPCGVVATAAASREPPGACESGHAG